MTDKIDKGLAELTHKELAVVETILEAIKAGAFAGLNVAKLKGYTDIFRVRKGRLRIIFQQTSTTVKILAIERRSEKTYRDF